MHDYDYESIFLRSWSVVVSEVLEVREEEKTRQIDTEKLRLERFMIFCHMCTGCFTRIWPGSVNALCPGIHQSALWFPGQRVYCTPGSESHPIPWSHQSLAGETSPSCTVMKEKGRMRFYEHIRLMCAKSTNYQNNAFSQPDLCHTLSDCTLPRLPMSWLRLLSALRLRA